MIDKDPLYARLTLDSDEYHLYEEVHQRLAVKISSPDLVIYLQAPLDVLMNRIRNRGILFERYIRKDFLMQLSESYTRFFLNYTQSALLMVNAENLNFLDNDEYFAILLEEVDKISSGRHFFNPVV